MTWPQPCLNTLMRWCYRTPPFSSLTPSHQDSCTMCYTALSRDQQDTTNSPNISRLLSLNISSYTNSNMGSKVLVMVLAFSLVLSIAMAQPLIDEDHEEDVGQPDVDYTADLLERLLARSTQKRDDMAGPYKRWRSCIRRSGACDHRPNDCCYNSSCRCNLWGTNCRCQRMGLFQQWGK